MKNLKREGFDTDRTIKEADLNQPGTFLVGDIMYDCALYFQAKARENIDLARTYALSAPFILATVHRPSNTDHPDHLTSILEALVDISIKHHITIALPLHPRTKSALQALPKEVILKVDQHIRLLPPVSYLEMIALQSNAELIITDSGGIQKEAYFHRKACIILRDETEWTELLETGLFVLSGPKYSSITAAYEQLISKKYDDQNHTLYGNGDTALRICQLLVDFFRRSH